MPLYYFHIQEPNGIVTDEEGQEFADIQAAALNALESVRDIVGESVRMGKGAKADHSLQVADGAGKVLLTLPFTKVLEQPSGNSVRARGSFGTADRRSR